MARASREASSVARGLEWRDRVTEPRQIEPGRTLMVTTRTFRRTFFLTPSSTVNDVMQYVIGYACQRHGVGLVSAVVLSNHMHLLVNDHLGNAPEFVQTVNSLVARALNAKRGEHGGMFARDNVDLKLVCGRSEAITAIAYIGANPVAAACVEHGRLWLGLRSQPLQLTRTQHEVSRPTFFWVHRDPGYPGTLTARIVLRYELPLLIDVAEIPRFVVPAYTGYPCRCRWASVGATSEEALHANGATDAVTSFWAADVHLRAASEVEAVARRTGCPCRFDTRTVLAGVDLFRYLGVASEYQQGESYRDK